MATTAGRKVAMMVGATLLVLTGCDGNKIDLGAGPERDGRLIADVFTWYCNLTDDQGEIIEEWEGAFGYNVTLQHAPDALPDLSLPESGCEAGVDLFPADAGGGGADLDTQPGWSNSADLSGTITAQGNGFYREEVFANRRTCGYTDDILGDGTELTDAGDFSGAKTPAPGTFSGVTLSGAEVNPQTGIPFGAQMLVEWDATGWDQSFVQIRREQGGVAVETATCNGGTSGEFEVGDNVWGLLHDVVEVDVTNIYVGVQSTGTVTTPDGLEMELTTRMMHIAIVDDG